MYSAIIALKTSYLFLAALHFMVLLFGYFCFSKPLKATISWGAKVTISSCFLLSPWVFLYSSRWLTLLSNAPRVENSNLESLYSRYAMKPMNLFSLEPLYYGFGETFVHYTFAILLLVLCCLLVIKYRYPKYQANNTLLLTAFVACATAPILYIFYMMILNY